MNIIEEYEGLLDMWRRRVQLIWLGYYLLRSDESVVVGSINSAWPSFHRILIISLVNFGYACGWRVQLGLRWTPVAVQVGFVSCAGSSFYSVLNVTWMYFCYWRGLGDFIFCARSHWRVGWMIAIVISSVKSLRTSFNAILGLCLVSFDDGAAWWVNYKWGKREWFRREYKEEKQAINRRGVIEDWRNIQGLSGLPSAI
jgi:hypothetical protein